MNDFKLLINGRLTDGARYINIINPANERTLARCPLASPDQLDQAVASAQRAFEHWRLMPLTERGGYLNRLADAIAENVEAIAPVLTGEQGKPLAQARAEVNFAESFCRTFADMSLTNQVLQEDDHRRVELHRLPLGVVAAITPWNYPFLIAVYKLAPALLAGNTLVLKPAPTTPLSTLLLGKIAAQLLPAGVLNIITDNNDLGPQLTAHPSVAKISFTGATTTGKKVMANAVASLKRLTLELGGNDAALVLDDINPQQAANAIFNAAFMNSGQVCIALKRLYVHERIYDPICEHIAALAKRAVVGDGMNETSEYGPVQNRAQYERVCAYIENARKHGKIIAGGEISRQPGYFIPLTVVRDIEDGTAVVDEEPFGPILPILRFHDEDDAIRRVNNSPYGLGASVWSSSVERAQAIAARIHAGTVWINQHCAFAADIPMPTTKQSGIGTEWGQQGLEEFTAAKVVNINKAVYAQPDE